MVFTVSYVRSLPLVDCLFCSICRSFRFSNIKESLQAPDITIASLRYFRTPASKDRGDRTYNLLILAWWIVSWGRCHRSETLTWRYYRLHHSLRQNTLRSFADWLVKTIPRWLAAQYFLLSLLPRRYTYRYYEFYSASCEHLISLLFKCSIRTMLHFGSCDPKFIYLHCHRNSSSESPSWRKVLYSM